MLDIEVHYEDLKPVIRYWARKSDSPEDLEQDIWVRVIETAPQYDPEKASPKTFVAQVARSVVVSQWRKETAQCRSPEEPPAEPEPSKAPSMSFKIYLKRQTEVQDVLPRRVFTLLKMGYSRNEICDLLDVSLYQVNKSKAQLRDLATAYLTS